MIGTFVADGPPGAPVYRSPASPATPWHSGFLIVEQSVYHRSPPDLVLLHQPQHLVPAG